MTKIKGGILINTGTWIKYLKKIKPFRLFILPAVYYHHYKLTITRIFEKDGKIISTNKNITKKLKSNLTFLQKFAIFMVPHRLHDEDERLEIDS